MYNILLTFKRPVFERVILDLGRLWGQFKGPDTLALAPTHFLTFFFESGAG